MSEVTVRALQADDWTIYRELRLAALRDAPDAFSSTFEEEQQFGEELWRERMRRSARLLATVDDEPVGVVSVGSSDEPGVAQLFGMWVVPAQRGGGVAWRLTESAADHARSQGSRALQLWVSTDNGRAVAFFSSYGFRPGNARRLTTTAPQVEEVSMIVPLGADPGTGAISTV